MAGLTDFYYVSNDLGGRKKPPVKPGANPTEITNKFTCKRGISVSKWTNYSIMSLRDKFNFRRLRKWQRFIMKKMHQSAH